MAAISFFVEDVEFTLLQKRIISSWIRTTIHEEGFKLEQLNFIFCSDEYLLQVNRDYLDHDYYTDIITFSQAEDPAFIEGDIFISLDRVKENAGLYQVSVSQELKRVMIHGVLHLCGYTDASDEEKEIMRAQENLYLSRHPTPIH